MRITRPAAAAAAFALAALAAAALAVAVMVAAPGPATPGDEGRVPPDAAAQFDEGALATIRENSEAFREPGGEPPDLDRAARFGIVFRIAQWSPDFVSGRSSARPVVELDEWLAPFLDERGEAIGTYRVWRPAAGAPAGGGAPLDDLRPWYQRMGPGIWVGLAAFAVGATGVVLTWRRSFRRAR